MAKSLLSMQPLTNNWAARLTLPDPMQAGSAARMKTSTACCAKLAQQAVEVFIRAALPACIGSGKVSRAAQLFVNGCMLSKLFAIVVRQGLDLDGNRFELVHDGRAHQTCRFVCNLGDDCIPALSLYESHDGSCL